MTTEISLTYETYLEVQKATSHILSNHINSHAYFDFHRTGDANVAYQHFEEGKSISKKEEKSYLTDAILPQNISDLSPQHFSRLSSIYGDGLAQLRIIDRNLQNWLVTAPKEEKLLSVGGACAQESVDSKIIDKLTRLSNGNILVKRYMSEMLERFPSWTQITGALIPTNGINVMYDETFPWYFRIKELGIKDSEFITQRVYDSIFAGVTRYVKLFNPNNTVVKIPFIKLDLVNQGLLTEWFKLYQQYIDAIEETNKLEKAEYEPDNRLKSWVEYTYNGPRILEINKKIIQKLYPDYSREHHLEQYTIHVRGKQIDHLDSERSNKWMHAFLLNNIDDFQDKRIQTLLHTSPSRQGLAMYSWIRDNLKNYPSIGFSGFLDFNYQGKLLHESIVFDNTDLELLTEEEMMEYYLDCPLRLHSHNIDNTIEYLNRFKSPHAVSFSKETLMNLTHMKKKIKKTKRKIDVVHQFIFNYSIIEYILQMSLEKKTFILSEPMSQVDIDELLNDFYNRHKENKKLRIFFNKECNKTLTTQDILQKLRTGIKYTINKNGRVTINIEFNDQFRALVKFIIPVHKKYKAQYIEQIATLEKQGKEFNETFKTALNTVSKNIAQYQSDHLTRHINILPLSDNMFVSYMQRLLFVPAIRSAYLDMAAIEEDRRLDRHKKEDLVLQTIQAIHAPVIECIMYIMKDGDYPWKARFESQYDRIY